MFVSLLPLVPVTICQSDVILLLMEEELTLEYHSLRE
jgi:hypothetical protein